MTPAEEEALLACVSNVPESATTIYYRVAGLPDRKSLTAKRRRERREVATKLHQLALRGVIQRGEGDIHPVPMYSLPK